MIKETIEQQVVLSEGNTEKEFESLLLEYMAQELADQIKNALHGNFTLAGSTVRIEPSIDGRNFHIFIEKDIATTEMLLNNPIRPQQYEFILDAKDNSLKIDYIVWENDKSELHRLDGPAIVRPGHDDQDKEADYFVQHYNLDKNEYDSHPEVEHYRRITRSSEQGEGVDL